MSPKKPAVLASVLTELVLGPVSHLRNTVQSQLASAVTTKHPRHRNRKFERLLEPNPAPTTITPFVSVYTLHMPPPSTLFIILANKNEIRNTEKTESASSVSHPSTHPTATPVSIPLQTTTTIPNDGERFFFEDIFHVVSFFKYAAGPGEKL